MIFSAASDIWSAFREFNSQAIIFGLGAALIYSVFIIASNLYRIAKKKEALSGPWILYKMAISVLLGIYASYTISLTLSGREAGSRSGHLSLVPGTTIFTGNGISIVSIENWLLFIPFGILFPILWKYLRSVLRTGILSFIASMLIELTQLYTGRGYFEIDDIILNTFGALSGYFIFACFYDGFLLLKKRTILDVAKEMKITPPLGALFSRYMVDKEWAAIILQLSPIVFMCRIIMGFSSDPGQISRNWSRPIAFFSAKIIGLFNPNAATALPHIADMDALMALQSQYLDLIEKIIRKLAHVTEYALLAFFVWALIYSRPYIKRYFSYIFGIVAVFVIGLFDEFNQTHIEGRFGSIKDVGVDLFGALLAMIISAMIVKHMLKLYRNRFNK